MLCQLSYKSADSLLRDSIMGLRESARTEADCCCPDLLSSHPGDNEWTDCDRSNDFGAAFNSLERMSFIRKTFFNNNPFSGGQKKLRLDVQVRKGHCPVLHVIPPGMMQASQQPVLHYAEYTDCPPSHLCGTWSYLKGLLQQLTFSPPTAAAAAAACSQSGRCYGWAGTNASVLAPGPYKNETCSENRRYAKPS